MFRRELLTDWIERGDPIARPMLRSALALLSVKEGKPEAAARIVADQVAKRPILLRAGMFFAIEATELLLAGAVAISEPKEDLDLDLWRFAMRSYPEELEVRLELHLNKPSRRPDAPELTLVALRARAIADYDKTMRRGLDTLTLELCAFLGKIVALERT